ncbi:MAG: NAD(P)-dependent glycerol-3-phosphate dehydrogenase [Deltaproteobacteria bacterium]|jgi:glycerol-3-phosphate dehydrogenase (NAD(P)+)|nr:NAD(P)-dependent glycerol-3-phosphate dehydrogenase [Deltaproteobacteria bacterium]
MTVERIAVIGAGSWGTALTKPIGDLGQTISLWGHRKEHVAELKATRQNKAYLPGYRLPQTVTPVSDLREAVEGHTIVIMVVPSHVFREVFTGLEPYLERGAYVISASKGIENDSLLTMTQVMEEILASSANAGERNIGTAVLSGPSFAKEVAAGIPTAVTVASLHKDTAIHIQRALSSHLFRVYAATDVIGLELGGALKNIIAIGAGICDGLGYGTNTRAALITRGLAEISRLGVSMGADPLTFSGLGGLGDLVLTCTGDLSRNRTVGLKLGQGKKLDIILSEMNMVAEGVKTTRSAWNLAKKVGVEMPILEQVYQVLYQDKPCKDAVRDLLARSLKEEQW